MHTQHDELTGQRGDLQCLLAPETGGSSAGLEEPLHWRGE